MPRRSQPATRRGAPCAKCGTSIRVFRKDKRSPKGGYWSCRTCERNKDKRWKARHPNANREFQLRRRYGISGADYAAMCKAQKGRCAICDKKEKNGKRLSVDHDHKTGRVRGLLCGMCNRALGKLGDDPVRLLRAAEYLTEGRE